MNRPTYENVACVFCGGDHDGCSRLSPNCSAAKSYVEWLAAFVVGALAVAMDGVS